MKVLGVTLAEAKVLVSMVSVLLYERNLVVLRGVDRSKRDEDGKLVARCSFSLGVVSGKRGMPGAACIPNTGSRRGDGPRGRESRSIACWHAHHDVIEELLDYRDWVVVQTARATYRAESFVGVARASAFENLGTRESPERAKDLCECGSDGWPELK